MTIFLVAHNKNHLEILRGVKALLDDSSWITIPGFKPPASEELRQMGVPSGSLEDMVRTAKRGDVVLVCNDWIPDAICQALDDLNARGVTSAAVVEGCRFTLPNKYTRVRHVLGWGPSILERRGGMVVGSPAIEETISESHKPRGELAIINYRFKKGEGLDWLETVVAACKKAGYATVISTHPASVPADARHQISEEPVNDLLRRATLLVTRPSTLAFQAMALGVQTVLFPAQAEELGEFAEPLSAYPIVWNSKEAIDAITGRVRRDPRSFLTRHVDIEAAASASMRIARAVLEMR